MLEELQDWYLAQCNGEWEHGYGVSIETLDNPGWSLRIELTGTALQDKPFSPIEDTEPESSWVHCKVQNRIFEAHCGPLMLSTVVSYFLNWARL